MRCYMHEIDFSHANEEINSRNTSENNDFFFNLLFENSFLGKFFKSVFEVESYQSKSKFFLYNST